jgi:formylglycine-generating enzyme required for sulfatase activity
MQSSMGEQPVTHLKIPKRLAVQTDTSEQPVGHTIGEAVLIPAGDFLMGGSDSDAESDEQPVHTVYVDTFYIDKYEVTNAQYKKFVDANPQWQKDNIPRYLHNGNYLKFWTGNTYHPSKANHPVVYVSWYAALAYAKWASKRLPTEAEWEKAARGGVAGRKYPWGNLIDSTKANYGRAVGKTTPVGTYPANDYGLYDMVGNVMEWCLDAYETDYYSRSSFRNPIAGDSLTDLTDNFHDVTSLRVLRSGYWYNSPMHVRIADRYRASPDDASRGYGFRCAASATGLSD